MLCQNSNDEPTLPTGNGVSAPLAVLNLHAAAAGTDNLSLEYTELVDSTLSTFLACWPTGQQCLGATNELVTPTATNTPTATATYTPTATPSPGPTMRGVGGAILLPPAALSAEAKSTTESEPRALAWLAVLGVMAGMGAVALCLKRRKA